MNKNRGHIISGLRWHTSFDDKVRASQLQERLSHWSGINMKKEISHIFDKMCPPEQIWKIQTLELDLGPVDYFNLEAELTEKLRIQLHERLMDLMIYANKNDSLGIEILDEETSHIDVLSGFLTHGVMPWNYSSIQGSVNQLMAVLLQNNRRETIAMLREVWETHEDTRKRIAWQMSEPNIIKIIEELEPGNHKQIVEFTNELTQIQEKERIVQASIPDFKKNLWLWVLKYLLNDRGTMFNRVAFMKSSIRQMADHYNIRYDELLELIERAVAEASERITVKSDFVVTLQTISRETGISKKREGQDGQKINSWQLFESLLKDSSLRRSQSKKTEFNKLLIDLHGEDRSRFSTLLFSLGNSEILWSDAINDLNDPSMEVVLSALSPARSAILVEHIYFLDKLSAETNLAIERKVLWKTGVKFLLKHAHSPFDSGTLINYFISDLSKKNHHTKENILEQLIAADIPIESKSVSALGIYSALTSVFISELSKKNPGYFEHHFQELTDLFAEQILRQTIDRNHFYSLRRSIRKYIEMNPGNALAALIHYPDKAVLQKVLPYLLDEHLMKLLIRNTKGETVSFLSAIMVLAMEMKANGKTGALAELISENSINLGLHAAIFYPGLKPSEFIEFILKELFHDISASQFDSFALFVTELLAHKKITGFGISGAEAERIILRYGQTVAPFSLRQISENKIGSPLSQTEVLKKITVYFGNEEFADSGKLNNKEAETLLNSLLPNGRQIRDSLIKEYTILIAAGLKQASKEEISFLLNELYSKCLLDHKDHSGKTEAFKRSFRKAVAFNFKDAKKNILKLDHTASGFLPKLRVENVQLENGYKISVKKLFTMIGHALNKGSETIIFSGLTFRLNELMRIGLEKDPAVVRRIMAKNPVTKKRIETLNACISMDEFSLLIFSDTEGLRNDSMEALRSLFDLVSRFSPGPVVEKVQMDYLKKVWGMVHSRSWSKVSVEKFMRKSFQHLVKETGLSSVLILSEMKANNIRLHPVLLNVLAEWNTSFSDLASDRLLPEELLLAENKGLLNDLIYHLISRDSVPGWFGRFGEPETKNLLDKIVEYYPVKFFHILKGRIISEKQMFRLNRSLNFKGLIRAIGYLDKNKEQLMGIFEGLYKAFGTVPVRGIAAGEMQFLLFSKIMKAWTTNSWKGISVANIWNELLWDACIRRGISKEDFLSDISKVKSSFPLALQISFDSLNMKGETSLSVSDQEVILKPAKQLLKKRNSLMESKKGVPVKNAGVVLLNSYLPVLFERLAIVSDNKFTDEKNQSDAVHYLQYLVTGLSGTEEPLLPLNKVLCGLPLSTPVYYEIAISEDQKKLMDELLHAAISHWPAIGSSSLNGFRGNWLVRDGMLAEQEDKWELRVEKRAYDVLISRSPFSFSIIKYPWMKKPLHVFWLY